MNIRTSSAVAIGKAVRKVSRATGGNGAALPGLVVEKLHPDFLRQTLGALPDGIVIITGTNGKTTTTKIITDLLRANGKKVLTNKTGSNFTRGIVATVIEQAAVGKKLDHDIAVIELDEAYAKKFVEKVTPTHVVALNVMRDQLDRFGEIDTTAKLIGVSMEHASKAVIVNADDEHLSAIAAKLSVPVQYYGVAKKLRKFFPTDEEIAAVGNVKQYVNTAPLDVELTDFDGQNVTYSFGKNNQASAGLQLVGQYNFQNAAAALALLRTVIPDVPVKTLVTQLAHVAPAFGRGEILEKDGQQIELLLIKNPGGFRQALLSFTKETPTMIAINDNDPDGRDISWLWDVQFDSLRKRGVAVTTGRRASDMALRLQYDNVNTTLIEPNLKKALVAFLGIPSKTPKRIYANYTAMLALRALLGRPEHGDYDE